MVEHREIPMGDKILNSLDNHQGIDGSTGALCDSDANNQATEVVRMTGWNLTKEARLLPPYNECPTPNYHLVMNVIAWNCRGALKALFIKHASDLANNHNLAIMIIMETRIGGERAKEITDKLPFDGAIHTNTIGYVGGLWLIWNTEKVHVTQLAKSEQEIHISVKVISSNLDYILIAIYDNPKFRERCILWNNLKNVANLRDKP